MLSIRIRQLEELNDPTDRIQGDYVTAGNSNYMTIHAKDYIKGVVRVTPYWFTLSACREKDQKSETF